MLILTRKVDQKIRIGDDITLTIIGFTGDQVKIKSYDLNSSVIFGYGLMNY